MNLRMAGDRSLSVPLPLDPRMVYPSGKLKNSSCNVLELFTHNSFLLHHLYESIQEHLRQLVQTVSLCCPGKSVVMRTDRSAMTIAVDMGRKATKQTKPRCCRFICAYMHSLDILSKAQIKQVQDASQKLHCTTQIQLRKRWMACSNINAIAPT